MKTDKDRFYELLGILIPRGAEIEHVEIMTNLNEGSLGASIKFTYNVKEQDHVDRWVETKSKTDSITNVNTRDIGQSKNYWDETHTYREIEYCLRIK